MLELLDKPAASAAVVALIISATLGYGAGRWAVRSLYPELAAVVSAVLFVALIIEAAVPPTWHHLLVDSDTWRSVLSFLRIPGGRTLLAGCILVGLAGASERSAFGDRDRLRSVTHPALAVLPALVLVTWSAAATPGLVSGVLCGGLIVLGGLIILVGDQQVRNARADPIGPMHRGHRWKGTAIALLPPLAAFLIAVFSVSVSGALGTRGGGPGKSGAPTTEALVTNVVGFAAQDPNVVLFRARSEDPTYWQVAVLTRQVGGMWEVSPGLARVLAGEESPSSVGSESDTPAGSPSTTTANVTIVSYRGRVLPVPLGTSAVQGPWPTRSVDDAVVQQRVTTPGEHYVATGSVSPIVQEGALPGSANEGNDAPDGEPAPASSAPIPAEVRLMARQVVAGSNERAEMVQRLVNWFRSGRFQYSTAAQPESPRGTTPVVAFLTRTKVGNCQTFTDAFAMMAQSLGIPVRVAVGFTSGARQRNGTTVVTGADAHTWPEVFGGPGSGWESVEPTPASSVTAILPLDVRGVGPVSRSTPSTSPTQTPTSVSSPTSQTTSTTPASTTPTVTNDSSESQPVPDAAHQAPGPWILVAYIVLAAAFLTVIALVRRRKARHHVGPGQAVLEAWSEADQSLARLGLGCPRSRTPLDHASTLREAISGLPGRGGKSTEANRPTLEQLVSDVESLALLERAARYGDRPTGEGAASAARAAAGRVKRSLRSRHVGRTLRGLHLTSRSAGQAVSGTDRAAYASSGHGANHP